MDSLGGMLSEIVSSLTKNGVTGVTTIIFLYLFLSQHKRHLLELDASIQRQIADTAAKVEITHALVDLTELIKSCHNIVMEKVDIQRNILIEVKDDVDDYLSESRIEKEVSRRISIPKESGKNE